MRTIVALAGASLAALGGCILVYNPGDYHVGAGGAGGGATASGTTSTGTTGGHGTGGTGGAMICKDAGSPMAGGCTHQAAWALSGTPESVIHAVTLNSQDDIGVAGYYTGAFSFAQQQLGNSAGNTSTHQPFIARISNDATQTVLANEPHMAAVGGDTYSLSLNSTDLATVTVLSPTNLYVRREGSLSWTTTLSNGGQNPLTVLLSSGIVIMATNVSVGSSVKCQNMAAPIAYSAHAILVERLDDTGNCTWGRVFDATANITPAALTEDGNGNVVLAGNYTTTITDLGGGQMIQGGSGPGAFLVGLDAISGVVSWAKGFSGQDPGSSVKVSAMALGTNSGRLYLSGAIKGKTTLGSVPDAPGTSALVMGIEGMGTVAWAEWFGNASDTSGARQATGIGAASTSMEEDIYVAGTTTGALFDKPGGAGGHARCAAGGGLFLLKLDKQGTPVWGDCFGAGYKAGEVHVAASASSLVLAGAWDTNIDFGLGLIPAGMQRAAFVARFDLTMPF
jgi:hypothetical protein